MSSEQNIQMNREEFRKSGKLISKVGDVIRDIEKEHFSDAVIHSKMLIDYLIFQALKKIGAPNKFIYGKNISDEEKFGFLFDKKIISEAIFDNCLITKGVRNPTIHGLTYPNKHFAMGAVISTIELYYTLQVLLYFPHLDNLDEFAKKNNFDPPILFCINTNRFINIDEYKRIETVADKFSGLCVCMVNFPEGTIAPNGEKISGIQMNEKVKFCKELIYVLEDIDFIKETKWTAIDVIPKYPNTEQHIKKLFPSRQ